MMVLTTGRNRVAPAAVCLTCPIFGLEISRVPTILPALEKQLPPDFPQFQWIMVKGGRLPLASEA